ncbi:MAG: hypothetical protein NC253_10090 [Ruminococcus sp.]|nr:hypothetical protein [Ruminococcus sp.]MCM1381028.1 hypothetical protein [Muribaculaceae bacterium]MCM1479202.1 hypothetical protein [Muribaculaceae bacterium]
MLELNNKYYMRFMFDWASGTCLWADNAAAQEKFGDYFVDLSRLPVSAELKKQLEEISLRFDTALNWDEPNGDNPILWTDEQTDDFCLLAEELYKKVCAELGEDYVITYVDCCSDWRH